MRAIDSFQKTEHHLQTFPLMSFHQNQHHTPPPFFLPLPISLRAAPQNSSRLYIQQIPTRIVKVFYMVHICTALYKSKTCTQTHIKSLPRYSIIRHLYATYSRVFAVAAVLYIGIIYYNIVNEYEYEISEKPEGAK